MTKRMTAVESARDLVLEQRGKLLEWETTLASARDELAQLERGAGELALDDPAAALALPKRMQEQRDRILTAERAIEAQRPRVVAAESAYLVAHAVELEAPVKVAKAALAKHQERTAELLALLVEHEGTYVPEPLLIQAQLDSAASGVSVTGVKRSWEQHKSQLLEGQVAAAELPVRILRDLAAGREPVGAIEAYPACVVGADALVPAPKYLRTLDREAQAAAAARNNLELVEQRVAELEARVAAGEQGSGGLQDWTMAPAPTYDEQLVAARRQRDLLRERLGEQASGRESVDAGRAPVQ